MFRRFTAITFILLVSYIHVSGATCICLDGSIIWERICDGWAAVKGVFGYGASLEKCAEPWIPNPQKINDLRNKMNMTFYGQHIATDVVLRSIVGHLQNPNPDKALVLSFWGIQGTGKTYLSKMIAESLYSEGLDSQYVYQFFASEDKYKHQFEDFGHLLESIIESTVKKCERSLFILDEVDKLMPGTFSGLKRYMDNQKNVHGIDFRKSIFILMFQNDGGSEIVDITYRHWHAGEPRKTLERKDFDKVLRLAYNSDRAGSSVAIHRVIDAYIPFLPLERQHLLKCIKEHMRKSRVRVDKSTLEKIADEFVFFPEDEELYSLNGCRGVQQKVDLVLEDWHTEL